MVSALCVGVPINAKKKDMTLFKWALMFIDGRHVFISTVVIGIYILPVWAQFILNQYFMQQNCKWIRLAMILSIPLETVPIVSDIWMLLRIITVTNPRKLEYKFWSNILNCWPKGQIIFRWSWFSLLYKRKFILPYRCDFIQIFDHMRWNKNLVPLQNSLWCTTRREIY